MTSCMILIGPFELLGSRYVHATVMSSAEALEHEKLTLCHKLSNLEREAKKKDELLKNCTAEKKQLAEELCECKRVQKGLLNQVEEASTNELIAKGDLNSLLLLSLPM